MTSISTSQESPNTPEQEFRQAFFATEGYLAANAIIPIRARLVRDLLGDLTDCRILDLGCGNGAISLPLLGHNNRLTLVDLSNAMLARARASVPHDASVELVHADVLDYVPEMQFDVVICVGVLAHVVSVKRLMARVAEAVRPGGLCVIQITDDAQLLGRVLNRYSRLRWKWGGGNELTFRELNALASEHGLQLLAARRYGLELPGTGRLPYSCELRLEELVADSSRLSRLAGEIVASFAKQSVEGNG